MIFGSQGGNILGGDRVARAIDFRRPGRRGLRPLLGHLLALGHDWGDWERESILRRTWARSCAICGAQKIAGEDSLVGIFLSACEAFRRFQDAPGILIGTAASSIRRGQLAVKRPDGLFEPWKEEPCT